MPARADARMMVALAGTLLRYRLSVAGVVARELARWRRQAASIADPDLRELALAKLDQEGANARAAAMLATHAPPAQRADVARAIVALEVLFDYLDGRGELPAERGQAQGRRLFAHLHAALWAPPPGDEGRLDADYLAALSSTVRSCLQALPRAATMAPHIRAAAERAAEAQALAHAAIDTAADRAVRAWAEPAAAASGLDWREYAAGAAASVIAVHALIAAAAHPSGAAGAEIDAAYLSVCALATLLDGVVDRDSDIAAGLWGPLDAYTDSVELTEALLALARLAARRASELDSRGRDRVILAGVLAHYMSAPGARSAFARPILVALRAEHRALLGPALMLTRGSRR